MQQKKGVRDLGLFKYLYKRLDMVWLDGKWCSFGDVQD